MTWIGAPEATPSTSRTHGGEVGDEVRLVQDDDRPRAAVPGRREIALDAPQVEVVVEAADQEDGVDVGGDDLLFGGLAGDLAREAAAAGEQRLDGALVRRPRPRRHGDPVADGREAVAPVGLVAEPAADPGQDLAVGGADPVDLLVLEGDPAGTDRSAYGANAAANVSSQPRARRRSSVTPQCSPAAPSPPAAGATRPQTGNRR